MATIIPAPLPSDWPSLGVMHVKDEAAVYASEARGPSRTCCGRRLWIAS
jgi:hypothetical protein